MSRDEHLSEPIVHATLDADVRKGDALNKNDCKSGEIRDMVCPT